MLTATIDVNGETIGTLTCVNQTGGNGWCEYACRYTTLGRTDVCRFGVRHHRPDGAPALVATAMGRLAEAGIGAAQSGEDGA